MGSGASHPSSLIEKDDTKQKKSVKIDEVSPSIDTTPDVSKIDEASPSIDIVADVFNHAKVMKKAAATFRKYVAKKGVLAAAHTFKLNQAATKIEPKVTTLLKDLAAEFKGELVGLDYRFKTLESLQQKVGRDIHEANLKMLDDMGDQREKDELKRSKSGQKRRRSTTVESNLTLFDTTNQEGKEGGANKNDPKEITMRRLSLLNSIIMVTPIDETVPRLDLLPFKPAVGETIQDWPTSPLNRVQGSPLLKEEEKQVLTLVSPKGASVMHRVISSNESSSSMSSESKLFQLEQKLSFNLEKEAKEAEEEEMKIELKTLGDSNEKKIDIGKLVWSISDALRYTILLEFETYTNSVKLIMERLKKQNILPVSMKNFWPSGDGYQGINNVFGFECKESLIGILKIEIQFHTIHSFEQKMSSHDLYEKFRATMDPDLKMKIFHECCQSADQVPVPIDVLSIPHPKVRPGIFLENLHVNLLIGRSLHMKEKALNQVNKLCKALSVWDMVGISPEVRAELLSRSAIELRLKHEVQRQKALNNYNNDEISSAERESEIFKRAVMKIYDSCVINIILQPDHYAISTALIMTRLFGENLLTNTQETSKENSININSTAATGDNVTTKSGGGRGLFKEVESVNGWKLPAAFNASGVSGGVGISSYVTMEGEDDGVAFTPDDAYPLMIVFHTQESYLAVLALQASRSEFRLATTREQRKAALTRAKQAVQNVKVPQGARLLLADSYQTDS